ncbi:MAG: universal stress protein [Lysobacteraceae bacterium]|nr:MAG: universal stress protein [Xanthomonadaceae bacterium]
MKRISKILVVMEGKYDSQAMIAEVSAIADNDTKVTLLGVVNPPPVDPELQVAIFDDYELTATAQLEELSKLGMEMERAGISTTVQQAAGNSYEQVIRTAVAGGFDMVIKPAENEGGQLRLLFGSTDMQLFRMSPDPVWLFKPTPAGKLDKVMVAVDLLASDEEKSALAVKVLEWGKYVAETVDAELHIVHIWDLYKEVLLRGRVGHSYVNSLLDDVEKRHGRWLGNAIARSGINPAKVNIHLRKGDAKEMIPVIARDENIDLLVMGTVGRTGIPGFFIGNTADSVLRQVDCSVLAIKPDGFKTPVAIKKPLTLVTSLQDFNTRQRSVA